MKINKTNAARLLDKAKIAYELIPYEAVSYTHLDVYKRQPPMISIRLMIS